MPVVRELALKARKADVHLTIDAEEADRLELQMDVFEALLADDELFANGWEGSGSRSRPIRSAPRRLCEWVVEAARAHGRKLMVRLVKGAYWDTEIKPAQVAGLSDYPVFTRKVATDVSYLACAKKLLAASDVIYPAFATHNANTIGQVKALAARPRVRVPAPAWHGRGAVRGAGQAGDRRSANRGRRCASTRRSAATRSCSPISFGACSRTAPIRSFVNRIADEQVSLDELVRDPVAELEALEPKRNPKIVLPPELFGAERRNSAGVDLSRSAGARAVARAAEGARKPQLDREAGHSERARRRPIVSPHDHRITVGTTFEAVPPRSTGWSAPGMPRRSTGMRLAAKRARSCSTARPTFTRSIARNSSRSAFAKPGRP